MKRFPLFVCLFLLLVAAGIPAAAAVTHPTINYITPSSGPNNGVVTVTIIGSGFNSQSTVYLTPANKCDGTNKLYGTVSNPTANSMVATFSLNGKTPAPYTLWVNSPVTDINGNNPEPDMASLHAAFEIYQGTGSTYATTATTTTVTATVTTTATPGNGENSVFFETNPPGATIFLNGNEVGTSTFTYYTNQNGLFDVVVKKIGYENYEAKVSIIEGQRVHFYAPLTQLSSGSTAATTPASGIPVKTVTTIKKSTLKVPTPLGTFAPAEEESPADPAIALGAAGIAIGLVLLRRR